MKGQYPASFWRTKVCGYPAVGPKPSPVVNHPSLPLDDPAALISTAPRSRQRRFHPLLDALSRA
jgi:hypothetical protein